MTTLSSGRHCKATNSSGRPCGQSVGPKFNYCLHHDPARAVEREAMIRKGATAAARLQPTAGDPDLSTRKSRRRYREHVAGQVVRGELSEKAATVALRAADGAAQEEQAQLRTVLPTTPITVNILVLDADGSSRTVQIATSAEPLAIASSGSEG